MINPVLKGLRDERGEGALTLPITLFLIFIVLYLGVDFFGLYVTHQKLRLIASETLTVMKMENGWTPAAEEFYEAILEKSGFENDEVTIEESTPPESNGTKISRGDSVTLALSTNYEVHSIRPLKSNPFFIPLTVKLTGAAQKFVQPE